MAWGDIQGFHSIPCPQDPAHFSTFHKQRSHASSIHGWLFMFSDQAAFGAADGGDVEEETEMGGDAHKSRVSDPLAVYQDQIGLGFQRVIREVGSKTTSNPWDI
jgi:hypothetical protein